ncbi:MAG: hypothetical protein LC746_08975, partial [Acidobacteria bacterium]|nr:hypothetical protein [Acidobacteriota bacterium]
MAPTRLAACFLCLTLLASAAAAQESLPQNSERLKKKIDSVKLIYQRALARQYKDYVASLKQDVADMKEARAALDDPSSEAAKQLDAGIEKLSKELADAEAEAAALSSGTGEERAQTEPATAAPGKPTAQPPAGCENLSEDKLPPGTIWCGAVGGDRGLNENDPKLAVQTLAEHAAPILWFSPDEPLRQPTIKNRNIPIPEALPGDGLPRKYPLVYFRISRIIDDKIKDEHSGNYGFNIETTELALKSLDEVTMKYYF